MATATGTGTLIVSEAETEQAQQLDSWLARSRGQMMISDCRGGDDRLALPGELSALIQQIISTISTGGNVSLTHIPEEITTTTAATLLNVSRPTVMKFVRSGELPAHKVGSHTRLRSEDVLELAQRRKEQRRAERRHALETLRTAEDKLDG